MKWFIYDYFEHSHEQQYWRGQSEPIPPTFAREVVNVINTLLGSIKSNSWSVDDYVGGVLTSEGSSAIFRIYNGGRDHSGRPHRWVLLMACGATSTITGLDLLAALESPPLRAYGITTIACLAPFPETSPNFSAQMSYCVPAELGSFRVKGPEALERVRRASQMMTSHPYNGYLIVNKSDGIFEAWCSCLPQRTKRLQDRSNSIVSENKLLSDDKSNANRSLFGARFAVIWVVGLSILIGVAIGIGGAWVFILREQSDTSKDVRPSRPESKSNRLRAEQLPRLKASSISNTHAVLRLPYGKPEESIRQIIEELPKERSLILIIPNASKNFRQVMVFRSRDSWILRDPIDGKEMQQDLAELMRNLAVLFQNSIENTHDDFGDVEIFYHIR